MIVLRELIHKNGWKQPEAAERLSISQPRVSYLIHGQISKFSMDKLLDLAGYDFRLSMNDGIPSFQVEPVVAQHG
jgi:predicted XRE-type DNA-binding protein